MLSVLLQELLQTTNHTDKAAGLHSLNANSLTSTCLPSTLVCHNNLPHFSSRTFARMPTLASFQLQFSEGTRCTPVSARHSVVIGNCSCLWIRARNYAHLNIEIASADCTRHVVVSLISADFSFKLRAGDAMILVGEPIELGLTPALQRCKQ